MDISKKVDVILGGIHKVRSSLRGRGVFKKRTKTNKGEGGPTYLYVRFMKKLQLNDIRKNTSLHQSASLFGIIS